ncbi:hypothetical protein GCM10009760_20150 [Kitasatospora kazusensis]|uniref:Putative sensor domain-containing protein n=1 Tax=Kitasatospora kazusensis TaxID=407974 RepID=A0ABN2Z915_9ACTN
MTSAASRPGTGRAPTRPGPLRTWRAAEPWRAAGYLASYLVTGPALFAASAAALLLGAVLSLFTFGLPLLVAAALTVRGCAQVERGRAGLLGAPIPAAYRDATGPGLAARIRARCTDPAALRDCAYLVLLFPPLLVLDVLALALVLVPLAGVTLPLWYPSAGAFWPRIDTLPGALGTAAACLVLLPFTCYPLVAAARLHLAVAGAVLRPPADPLAEVRRVLAEPGPLARVGAPADPADPADR